jgi:hypothetical protein
MLEASSNNAWCYSPDDHGLKVTMKIYDFILVFTSSLTTKNVD